MKFETISPNGVSITLGSSQDGDTNKIASPKNIDKNKGININTKGIKFINISSCVNDIEIQ